ncbi:MAG: glycogen debranching protein GlgX [Paracoccaceae bacterium]|nr:glycogen debranching protein GlgX [Paracoccaceae bacterium]
MHDAAPILSIAAGDHTRLGAVPDQHGVNFAVFSENATKIELCLFSPDGQREIARLALPDRTGAVWHGFVLGLKPGALYGYRAHGSYDPDHGHRFNPNKLLADPYARSFHGKWTAAAETLGYDPRQHDDGPCSIDSAPFVPKSVVPPHETPWDGAPSPRRPWPETVIYEAHVKGLTKAHPGVPENLRGTYEALGCDAIIEHLQQIGVTALELLPVHTFLDDGFLVERGLTNYWGYNSIGYFALEPRYFGPDGAEGFRRAVDRLHGAGIEVILDVVYNHTAEGDHRGPTLSFRGLDNAAYYQLQANQARYFVNDSGCGNTVAVNRPFVLRMVLDSLRYWVTVMGIDGFRFDLATTLGREPNGFDLYSGFFDAIRQDPVLNRCKMIAEPWDIGPGGYQLGGFPADWAEWNDRFRDTTRKFWRGDAHAAQELAGSLMGTASVFDHSGRKPFSSINFVAAHDGFTLADVTRYREKHNEANGESNGDGHGHNFSDNCGVEGDTKDPSVLSRRAQRVRNLLATVFLSQGTPMLQAGDEMGRTQRGNNNTYCQDNETSWMNWAESDSDLLDFTRKLAALRRDHPVLRQNHYLHGQLREDGHPDVAWSDLDGGALNWRDPSLDGFCLLLRGAAETQTSASGCALIVINGGPEEHKRVVLPDPGPGLRWERKLDTAAPSARAASVAGRKSQPIAAHSIVVFVGAEAAP